jgi:hypothetical protein
VHHGNRRDCCRMASCLGSIGGTGWK